MFRASLLLALSVLMAACSSSDTGVQDAVPDAGVAGRFATQTPDATRAAEPDVETPSNPEDASEPSDLSEPESLCEEGKACNDGDLCTKNDVCLGGVCAGEAITCDDEPSAPCESAACVEGICQVTIDDGFCFIDGACWTEGQPNEIEPCQRCVPVVSNVSWANNDGASCGSGSSDPCNPSSCQEGACVTTPVECVDDNESPCIDAGCVAGECQAIELSGTPCEDGDACTSGELCDKGVCLGGSADCDDGLSCTSDACEGVACLHTVDPGFCAIDDMCLAAGESDPTNPCALCDPSLSQSEWSPQDGLACEDGNACTLNDLCSGGVCVPGASACPDDGDPCTQPSCENNACELVAAPAGTPCDDANVCTENDTCSAGACLGGAAPAELCDDALDNDCDGLTDEECDLGEEGCTYHADCYPEKLCGAWFTTGTQECSDPCAGDSDCPAGFICTKVPGSINAGFCEPAIGLGGQDAPCTTGEDCGTGLCVDSACAGGCLDDQHCTAPGHTCQMIGDLSIGFAGSACTGDGALKAPGIACSNDGMTWDSLQCASGHCDLTAPSNLPAVCSNVCTSQSDCTSGQVCGIVFHAALPYGNATNPDALPYHPDYQLPTYDGISGCHTAPFGTGFGTDATVCTANNQCQTGHCLPLTPGDPTRYCTRMCSVDADCPNSGMQCKLDVVNLVSGWLEAQGTENQNVFSLVRICKFK